MQQSDSSLRRRALKIKTRESVRHSARDRWPVKARRFASCRVGPSTIFNCSTTWRKQSLQKQRLARARERIQMLLEVQTMNFLGK
jgi:hypothetical protein